MDGTEDNMLWEDAIQEREVIEDETEVNDILQEDDPYGDAILESEWEELFNGNHARDD